MRKGRQSIRSTGPRFSRRRSGMFSPGKGRKSMFLGGTRLGKPSHPGESFWSAIKKLWTGG